MGCFHYCKVGETVRSGQGAKGTESRFTAPRDFVGLSHDGLKFYPMTASGSVTNKFGRVGLSHDLWKVEPIAASGLQPISH
jgi:hypothetical protein